MSASAENASLAFSVGVDVSKDHLDAALHPGGEFRQFANTSPGIAALLKWLGKREIVRIVFEATGPYHREFERRLVQADRPFVKANPLRARRFAQACGRLAKTDRLDALMLARFGATMELAARPGKSAIQDELAELVAARRVLVRDRTAALNRDKVTTLALLRTLGQQRLRQIEKQLAALDVAIAALIDADPALCRRRDILCSIPGVAAVTASLLLADMPELGSMDERQAASLAGLAPVTRQSGKWQGRSFIQGGRALVRRTLYMPALVAIRFNADIKRCYETLVANGKPPKLAITAVMRKLVVLANALLRDNRMWIPKAA